MRQIYIITLNLCDLHAAMEHGNGGSSSNHKITADNVISKLKDDGDFDRLRVKIIRKLKDNEELRNRIASMVRQSGALNRPGAESMKPRQLSDAIHQEVGGKVMDQISESLWGIIKSGDGMKSEIRETVKSVYSKLSLPNGNVNMESSQIDTMAVQKGPDCNGSILASVSEVHDISDSEPQEPPGFSQSNVHQIDIFEEQAKEEVQLPMRPHRLLTEEQKKGFNQSQDVLGLDSLDPCSPPGFSAGMDCKPLCDGSDEDPDVPPGFG